MISQDDLVSNTKTVTKGLESLRKEHESLLKVIKSEEDEVDDGKENLQLQYHLNVKQLLDLGLGEANVMTSLAGHLQSIEADQERLRSQILRLGQENNWLRDELEMAKVKLQVKLLQIFGTTYTEYVKTFTDK